MASINEWPDGYLLSMDPRREDPLFYYMKRDDWEHAIGLEVLPLYEERAAVEENMAEIMESGALANELKRLGFSQTPSVTPDSITWTRE